MTTSTPARPLVAERPSTITGMRPPLPLRQPGYVVLLVTFPLILFLAWYLCRPGSTALEWYISVAWSLPIFVSTVGIWGLVRSRRHIRAAQAAPLPDCINDRLTITIPTRGTYSVLPALRRVVQSAQDTFPEFFSDMHIEVVTEVDAQASAQIRSMIGPGIAVLTVPASYQTPNHAIRKARAAQFALDARTAVGRSGQDAWVLHLDDDTAVGRDTAIEVARFIIANRSAHDGLHLGQGVLTYPRQLAVSRFTNLADSLRTADDFMRFAAITGSGTPRVGLHGELLVVRASVEQAVGWDYPNEITEESRFALRFAGQYPGRSGWFAARCYGASPESARALVQQRRRWSNGLVGLVTSRSIPLRLRLFMLYCMATWVLGPLQSMFLIAGLGLALHSRLSPVAMPVIALWAANLAYVVAQYHIGLRANAHASGRTRPSLADRFLVTVLIPVFALCEGAGGLTGALQHVKQVVMRREKSFHMLTKSR
jgi:egghead protein (zeste-white 4 protein)